MVVVHPLGDVAPIGTGRLGVVVCASAGWSGATAGGGGVLGGSGSVGFRRWGVGRGSVGLE